MRRRLRRTSAAAGVAALALWLTATAAAETPASAERAEADAAPEDIARARYRAAVEAYKKRRYKDAVDLFLEADRLAPSAALSYNIARAYERLGDSAATLKWYRDYLRRAPDAGDAEEVTQKIADLEKKLESRGVQQMTVLSEPDGATVVVDDRPAGITPWTGELAPGSHRISLRLRGYTDAERTVELRADRAMDVVIPLAPAPRERQTKREPKGPPVPEPAKAAVSPAPALDAGERSPALSTAGWIVLGTGGATLGVGLAFEWLRRSSEQAAEDEPVQLEAARHLDTMEDRKTAARILVGAGAALVVAGGALVAIDLALATKSDARVTAGCAGDGCSLTARGSF